MVSTRAVTAGLVVLVIAACAFAQDASKHHPVDALGPHTDGTALHLLAVAAKASHSDALVVWKDGDEIAAWYFGKQPRRIHAMSITKAVVGLAVGRLITLGKLASVDEPVSRWYPEWRSGSKS